MSKSKQFKLLKIFQGKIFFEKYVSQKLMPCTVYKTTTVKSCQICSRVECEMKVQYAFGCSIFEQDEHDQNQQQQQHQQPPTQSDSCRYKIETCDTTQTIYLSKACCEMAAPRATDRKKKFGLTTRVKEIVEQIIALESDNSKPVHVQSILLNNYADFIDQMPTLRQIQSYISTRRKRLSNAMSGGGICSNGSMSSLNSGHMMRDEEDDDDEEFVNIETDEISVVSNSSLETGQSEKYFTPHENYLIQEPILHACSVEKLTSNEICCQYQNQHQNQNLFKFDQEDPKLSTQNSEESTEFLNDLNEAVFSLESCVDYFNEYNQIFNVNESAPNLQLIQNTAQIPWPDYGHMNFFEEEKHQHQHQQQQIHHHHQNQQFQQQEQHQKQNDSSLNETEENSSQNDDEDDDNDNDDDDQNNEEERDDDENDEEVDEETKEKRVPNSAEALKMFNGLKRFLAKYTPDSNDVIFDLEKKVNQGIENNKKIKKFCFN